MSTRVGSVVKRRRKPGMMAMQRTMPSTPCSRENIMPWVAARLAFSWSPAPR